MDDCHPREQAVGDHGRTLVGRGLEGVATLDREQHGVDAAGTDLTVLGDVARERHAALGALHDVAEAGQVLLEDA